MFSEVDQSLWPSGDQNVVSFKQQFESTIYRTKESDVDLDAWASLANLVLPLCHSDSLNGNSLPSKMQSALSACFKVDRSDTMDVSKDNGQAMRSAVTQQPASIAIEGDQPSFNFTGLAYSPR